MKNTNTYLYLIFSVIGYIFAKSSIAKIQGGNFVTSLAPTLEKFASKNPHPLCKSFLENIAIPNSNIFGLLTMWGEFFSGVTVGLLSLYLIFKPKVNRAIHILLAAGLLVGAFLNATFWMAAGWLSPSTESLNMVMFAVQIIGFFFVLQNIVGKKK